MKNKRKRRNPSRKKRNLLKRLQRAMNERCHDI